MTALAPSRRLHPVAGATALAVIATIWSATVLAELFGTPATVVAVKTAIPWSLLLLIPALAATGGSGLRLARSRRGPLVEAKARRMRVIAVNGLAVLVPAALFLAAKARAGDFDTVFVTVQAVELAAGALNLALLGRSMRDGLRLTGRLA